MSRQIDERVVSMEFDNRKFESNVQTSMSTIEKLKNSLNFKGAVDGMSGLSSATSKLDSSFKQTEIAATRAGFHIQDVFLKVASVAEYKLARPIANAMLRISDALTLQPVRSGFQEYETQIGAVQTILANTESKGSTLQDVNRALDELNVYADKTIYNFTEMTKNIGTFTAAGIGLEDSVKSIQGIANLAAVSGSTSEQASRAMYQLSQALSSGTVKLMDWNSVVNAGMGGQVFQDALLMTAGRLSGSTKSVAELREQMTNTFGSFRDSLQDGWITSEVLTKTLEHFTMAAEEGSAQWNVFMKQLQNEGYTEAQAKEIIEMANTATDAATKVKTLTQLWSTLQETAQSGWAQTWEIIVGDFEEAKEFYSEISNTLGGMIDGMSKARNKILEGALSSGWKQLLGTGIIDEEEYKNSITEVAKTHGVSMDEMIKAEKEAAKAKKENISDEEAYQRALKKGLKEGTLNADILTEAVGAMTDKMSKMSDEELVAAGYTYKDVEAMKELNEAFKNGTLSMDEYIKKMFEISGREKLIEALKNAFKGLMSVIKPIGDAFNEVFHVNDTEGMIQNVKSVIDAILEFSKKLTLSEETADKLKRTFVGAFTGIKIVWNFLKALVNFLKPAIGLALKLGGALLEATAWIGDRLVWLNDWIERADAFNKAFNVVGNTLMFVWNGLKWIGIAVADMVLIPAWEAFVAFLELIGVRVDNIRESTNTMKEGVSNAFKSMSDSFKDSPFYDFVLKLWELLKSVGKALGNAFSDLMTKLTEAFKNADFKAVMDIINTFLGSGIGLLIIKFLKMITGADKDSESAGESIKNFFEGLGKTLKSYQASMNANTVKTIATSLLMIAAALAIMCLIDSHKLMIAGGVLSAFIFELMYAFNMIMKTATNKSRVKNATSVMIAMSASLLIIASAIKKIGNLPIDNMLAAASAIGALMFAMVGVINMIPKQKIQKVGGTIFAMSVAMVIIASAMKIVGTMSWDQALTSVLALGAVLGIFIGALYAIPKNVGGTVASVMFLSTAMVILASALKIVSTIGGYDLLNSVLGLGAALVILVAAMRVMKGGISGALALLIVTPALVALAGVLKLLATVLTKDDITRALTALGGSLGMLALGLMAMKGAIPGAIALLLAAPALIVLSSALLALGALPMSVIGTGLLAMAGAFTVLGIAGYALSTVAPVIFVIASAILLLSSSVVVAGFGLSVIAVGITALGAALSTNMSIIVAAIKSIILGIAEMIPELIKILGKAIIEICKVIISSSPYIAAALTAVLTALVGHIVDASVMITEAVLKLTIGVLRALGENVVELGAMLFDFLMGLLDVLITYTPAFTTKLIDFILLVINGLSERMPELIQAGVNFIMSILQGVIDAMENIDPAFLEKAISACWQLTEVLGALSIIALLVPSAIAGVLALAVLAAHLTGVLWVFGKMAEIPGIMEVVGNGGNMLQAIGKGIGQFCGGLVGGFAQGVTSALPKIGSDLAGFMNKAKPFFDGIKDVNGDTLNAVANLAGAVVLLTANNVIDGLTSFITGKSSLESFASELPKLGTGLRGLLDKAGNFTDQEIATVNCAAEMIKVLASASKEIPNSGGLLGALIGNNDLGTFATQFPKVGTGIRGLLTGLGENGLTAAEVTIVQNAADAVVALATASKEIPNSGGLLAELVGDNPLGTFATQFPNVGKGIRGLLTALGKNGLTETEQATIMAAAEAITTLATAAQLIPNTGGWLADLVGDNSFSKFGEELPNVGKGVRGFADNLGTFTKDNLMSIEYACFAIGTIASLGPYIKDVNKNLKGFGEKLVTLGEKIGEWASKVHEIPGEKMSLAIARVSDVIAMANRVASVSIESLKTFGESLVTFAEDGVKGFAEALSAESPVQTAKEGVGTLVSHTVAAFTTTDNYTKFYNAGKFLVSGFALGMTCDDSVKKVSSAGASVGSAAYTALNRSILVKSPSRKAFESGVFFTQGAANGIISELSSVYNAGSEVGSDAISGMSDALSKVSDAVSLNIDADPVIRPVVDLSDVESSAATIGSLFDTKQSMRIMANTGAISSMMNNRQNGVNSDVVSAINTLSQRISDMDRASYTINGVTYDDGSNIRTAVETIVRAARIERRN